MSVSNSFFEIHGYIKGVMVSNVVFFIICLYYFLKIKYEKRKMFRNYKENNELLKQEDTEKHTKYTDYLINVIHLKLNNINNKFILISLFNFIICISLIILKCIDYYNYSFMKLNQNEWNNYFIFNIVVMIVISAFTSNLSIILFFINKSSIAKIINKYKCCRSVPRQNEK